MSKSVYTEARRVAQAFDLEVIPCGDRKQPLQKGWRKLATVDPQEEDFRGATFVGVPTGPINDLIVFDLDYYKRDAEGVPQPASNEVWDRLADFEEELLAAYPGKVRIHKTQSGGVHLIMRYPEGAKIPRSLMPNMEIMKDGHQFIWPTEGSGYTVEEDVPLARLAVPSEEFLKVRYKATGSKAAAGDSGRMTLDEAHEILLSDGAMGSRHDAMNIVAWAFVNATDAEVLMSLTNAEFAEIFRAHMVRTYPNISIPDRLFELRTDERDPSIIEGEIGRALAKPLAKARLVSAGAAGVPDRLSELGAAQLAKSPPLIMSLSPEREERAAERKAEEEARAIPTGRVSTRSEDVSEVLTPWLIKGFIREHGTLIVVGMSSVGKTTLSAAMIAGMLAGRTDVLGMEPVDRPLNVMWLNAEEPESDMVMHVKAAQHQHGLQGIGTLLVMGEEILENPDEPFGADVIYEAPDPETGRMALQVNKALVDRLKTELHEDKIDILIVDPITEFNGGNEDKRYDARMLNRAFRSIALETGVACVYWAHTGKPPESKRPDWYLSDIYAQRGSSQNTGATQGAATLTPMISHKLKSGAAWQAWTDAKKGDGRNLILFNTVKMKKYKTLPQMAFEIIPSDLDEDFPVALPVGLEEAMDLVATDTSANAKLNLLHTTQEIVKRLGVGRHSRVRAEKLLDGCLGVKTIRANQKASEEALRKWKRGVKVTIEGKEYMVTTIYEAGKSSVDFEVLNVTE